jgi:hypothetical protein
MAAHAVAIVNFLAFLNTFFQVRLSSGFLYEGKQHSRRKDSQAKYEKMSHSGSEILIQITNVK